jgi:hypothetical protein
MRGKFHMDKNEYTLIEEGMLGGSSLKKKSNFSNILILRSIYIIFSSLILVYTFLVFGQSRITMKFDSIKIFYLNITAILLMVYLLEFKIIRRTYIKYVNFYEDSMDLIFYNKKRIFIPYKKILKCSKRNDVISYHTSLNFKLNEFHKKGQLSSILFDKQIVSEINNKIDRNISEGE